MKFESGYLRHVDEKHIYKLESEGTYNAIVFDMIGEELDEDVVEKDDELASKRVEFACDSSVMAP